MARNNRQRVRSAHNLILVLTVIAVAMPIGRSIADSPENGFNKSPRPRRTVTVTPSDNLAISGQSVEVSGTGFFVTHPSDPVLIDECSSFADSHQHPVCVLLAEMSANPDGTFGPVSVQVSKIIVGTRHEGRNDPVATHTCAQTDDCIVVAEVSVPEQFASHHLSFNA